jgi:hypothetical protein
MRRVRAKPDSPAGETFELVVQPRPAGLATHLKHERISRWASPRWEPPKWCGAGRNAHLADPALPAPAARRLPHALVTADNRRATFGADGDRGRDWRPARRLTISWASITALGEKLSAISGSAIVARSSTAHTEYGTVPS